MRTALILLLCCSIAFADQITQEYVQASADDASCNGDPSNATAATISLTSTAPAYGSQFGVSKAAGFRFLTVPIPTGVTVDSAKVTLEAANTLSGATCNIIFYGEDTADATTFSTDTADWNARNLTTATVTVSAAASQTAGTDYTFTGFGPIIAEIVGRGDWAQNNDIVIFVGNNGSSTTAYRTFKPYDASTDQNIVPRLDVWYTVPSTGVVGYYHGTAGVGRLHSPQGNSVLHKK